VILAYPDLPFRPDKKPLTWPAVPGQGMFSRLDAVLPAVVRLDESGSNAEVRSDEGGQVHNLPIFACSRSRLSSGTSKI
jgi:hypothetical protein